MTITSSPSPKSQTPGFTQTPAGLRILALGDSYTIGESVAPAERWPVQLAQKLREQGLPVTDPQIIARTGWTTADLSAAIPQANPKGPFDLVTLLIGVNNQYQGRDLAEYRNQFRGLLRQSIEFAGGQPGRVIVVSIPDWGVTPFAEGQNRGKIRDEIDAFNQMNRAESESAGAAYVDITPFSRQNSGPEWLASDGLHPSGKMYSAWAELVLPYALTALAQASR